MLRAIPDVQEAADRLATAVAQAKPAGMTEIVHRSPASGTLAAA
jgi:hypothetical protein